MMADEGKIVETIQALVRPIVTLMFAGAVTYGWVHERLSDDAFLGLAGMTIGFWFTQRAAAATRSSDPTAPVSPPDVSLPVPP